jgi:endo-1,4-beta-mannosidase
MELEMYSSNKNHEIEMDASDKMTIVVNEWTSRSVDGGRKAGQEASVNAESVPQLASWLVEKLTDMSVKTLLDELNWKLDTPNWRSRDGSA